MEDILNWFAKNTNWVFSGIGVFGFGLIIRFFVLRARARKSVQIINDKSTGIQAGRNVNINTNEK